MPRVTDLMHSNGEAMGVWQSKTVLSWPCASRGRQRSPTRPSSMTRSTLL